MTIGLSLWYNCIAKANQLTHRLHGEKGFTMKKFRLTSTNPAVGTLSEAVSDSFNDLLLCAHRFAIGESNCDGCEHYYAITYAPTGCSIIVHSTDLVCTYARRYPWLVTDGGMTVKFDRVSEQFLQAAAHKLECAFDELLG